MIPQFGMDVLIRHGCTVWGLSRGQFTGRQKAIYIARPRQVLMWFAASHYGMSTPYIGRALGGRDHSTVVHGIQKVAKMLPTDLDVYDLWQRFDEGKPSLQDSIRPVAFGMAVVVTGRVGSISFNHDDRMPAPMTQSVEMSISPEAFIPASVIDEAAMTRKQRAGRA